MNETDASSEQTERMGDELVNKTPSASFSIRHFFLLTTSCAFFTMLERLKMVELRNVFELHLPEPESLEQITLIRASHRRYQC